MLQTNPSRVRYIKEGGICTSRPCGWVGYLAELRLLRWAQNDLYSSSSSCQNCVCSGAAAVFGKFLNVK